MIVEPEHKPQSFTQQSYEPSPVVADPVSSPKPALTSADTTQPTPIVAVLSPVGVEYVFQTITLFTGAIAAVTVLLALVNGKTNLADLSFPTAVLLITVPLFSFLFLRHKKMEVANPNQRLEPSKRRSTQFTQIVTFTVSLFVLIGFVFDLFVKIGGQVGPSIGKATLDALAVLVVSGGILAYYWHDEHRQG